MSVLITTAKQLLHHARSTLLRPPSAREMAGEPTPGGVLPLKAIDFLLLVLAVATFCLASRSFVRKLQGPSALHARAKSD